MPQATNGSEGDSPAGSSQGSSGRNKPRKNGKSNHYTVEGADNADGCSDIGEFISATRSAHQVMVSLGELYQRYATDIQDANENRQRVTDLKALCSKKDAEIVKRKNALDVMLERTEADVVALEEDKTRLAEEQDKFDQMKKEFLFSKQKEESRAKDLEDRLNRQADARLKKDTASLEKSFRERHDKLEKELKQREDQKKKRMTDLEAENKRLTDQVKDLKSETNAYVKRLALEKERLDDMEQLKRMSKDEATKAQNELQRMKDEFGLVSHTPEFFQEGFAKIANKIHEISIKFSQELNPKDWASLHEKLRSLDPGLASTPMSNSKESKLLRTAHMHRIISSNLSTLIFKPFSSDSTFQVERENAVRLLDKAALGLQRTTDNKRVAAVFKSLAMQGLRSSSQLQAVSPAPPTRVDAFTKAIKPFLSLLVPQAQQASLEDTLCALAQSAITLWDSAQSDEFLDLTASLDLDLALRAKWSSPCFDDDSESLDHAITSSTNPEILTLFPSITARAFTVASEPSVQIPGSFENSKADPQIRELVIHHGIGMCESSALVVRGKEEQQDMEEELKDEKLRKELEATQKALSERSKMKSQRNGSITSLPSPSAEWGLAGGNKKLPED